MLAQIRAFAKSPVATVLLGLLVVAFAVFGIADVFRNRVEKDTVVTAGPRAIHSAEFKQMFDQYKKQIEQQQNGGMPITTEQAVAAGIDRGLADTLAQQEAFAALMTKLGIVPSDKLVVQQIRKLPAFFDPVSGRFDRATYTRLLTQAGLTESVFEQGERDQIAEGQFMSGMAAGLLIPRTYLASVAAYNREGRDFSWFLLPPGLAGAPATPTDAQLNDFIKKNAPRFTKPELRQLSFVRFSAAQVAPTIVPSDADIQKRFNFEKDTLSTPEKRGFQEVPVKDMATGAKVAERLRHGEDPESVAKSLGVQTVTYQDAPKATVSDRKIADVVFGPVKAGDVIGPVQGALGIGVIKVITVTAGHQATLDDGATRDKIVQEIQKEQATEKVYQLVQKYEDARSGGANMAEAAKKAGLMITPLPVPITGQGATLQGQQANIPPKILQSAFMLPQSADSDVIDLGQGEYAAVRVDKVMPSSLATLDEVRPAVTQLFVIDTMEKTLQAKADALVAAMKKGETVAQAAASVGAMVQTATDVQRAAAGKTFSQDLLQKIFTAKPGDIVTGSNDTGDNNPASKAAQLGLVVAKLDKVGAGPIADLATQVEVQRDSFRNVVFNDFEAAVRNTARTEIKPTVDYAEAKSALGLDASTAPPPAGAKK